MIISIDTEEKIELIKARNKELARQALAETIETFKVNQIKEILGIAVDEIELEKIQEYAKSLHNDTVNPSSNPAYRPPLPPGVTPPAVPAIIAHITREPGWNNVLGWRIVLEISDPTYIPTNLAISVYSANDCTGYLYTCGALQHNTVNDTYFALCPPGQEKGNAAYHFGLLYGSAKLSCWTLAGGEQTKYIEIFSD